jgi:adenine-specific DNA-methyltransferase
MQRIGNKRPRTLLVGNLLQQTIIDQLSAKAQPSDIENAIVKVFLELNKLETPKVGPVAEAVRSADERLVHQIQSLIVRQGLSIDLKTVENAFERIFSDEEQREGGIQYTPDYIIQYIVDHTVLRDGSVCDPSCGSGGFLVSAAKRLASITGRPLSEIISTRIFGCDISQSAVNRAKILLSLLLIQEGYGQSDAKFNIICADSLQLDWRRTFPDVFDKGGFYAVLGNPPYVKIQNMKLETRTLLLKKWSTVSGGSHNLYIPFIQLGAELLSAEGTMGYIVSSMFFTSIASRDLRKYLQDNRLVRTIIDFGDLQVFVGKQTYTCIAFIDKRPKTMIRYTLITDLDNLANLTFTEVDYGNLNSRKWRLLSQKDHSNISKLEAGPLRLGKVTDIDTGIATLKDQLFFVDGTTESDGFYIKVYEGRSYPIEKEVTREIVKVSDLTSEADLLKNTRRIIFPYLKEGNHKLIPEDELAQEFPKTHRYLRAVRKELEKRDKGKKSYEAWYAYGRTQGLNKYGEKIFNPTFASEPRFILCKRKDMLFCNGYSISLPRGGQETIIESPYSGERGLELIWRILNSRVMDYYIKKTSYVIEGGYYCYQKQFTENFCLPMLTREEQRTILEGSRSDLDKFLISKYGLEL